MKATTVKKPHTTIHQLEKEKFQGDSGATISLEICLLIFEKTYAILGLIFSDKG